MSLITRIQALLGRGQARPAKTTADEMPKAPQSVDDMARRFSGERDRRSIVTTCRKMYEGDSRAEGVIKTLGRDMTAGIPTVSVSGGNARAEEVANALIKRLKLASRLDDWVRLTLRDGDSFLEVSVDGQLQVAGVTRKPTLEMHRNSNSYDSFDDPSRAFWWSREWWGGGDAPMDAIWFAQWQMVHARWNWDEGSRYGRPLFASATGPWKRMTEGETDIAVRRKTRAGMRYVHKFPPGTGSSEVEKYKFQNQDSLSNPTAAIADFFGTVDINAVQGDARLADIADVVHHIRTWWLASPVPMSLLGYGQDLNRDVLQEQKQQYEEGLRSLKKWVEHELIRPLIELQWLLAGIWPETLEYEIGWQVTGGGLKAAQVRDAADAGVRLRALGLSDDALWGILEQFLPGVDLPSPLAPLPGRERGAEAASAGRMARTADELRVKGG